MANYDLKYNDIIKFTPAGLMEFVKLKRQRAQIESKEKSELAAFIINNIVRRNVVKFKEEEIKKPEENNQKSINFDEVERYISW